MEPNAEGHTYSSLSLFIELVVAFSIISLSKQSYVTEVSSRAREVVFLSKQNKITVKFSIGQKCKSCSICGFVKLNKKIHACEAMRAR